MSEDKNVKICAKAQQTSSAEADLQKTISYIAEREANLDRYSDKLRQSLQKVFDVFGNSACCQICGTGVYSLDPKEKDKHKAATGHSFVPKINLSLDLTDSENFAETKIDELNKEYYRLGAENGELVIIGTTSDERDLTGVRCWYTYPTKTRETPSRNELKQLVQSGRLPTFLKFAAEKMAEAEQEYKTVAGAAEKMATVLAP